MSSNDHAREPRPSARETGEGRPDLTAGRYLREERIRQEISLAEVAAATGIRIVILQAIEEDGRAHLPAAVFVRGFLKLYAEHLGLEADGVLARYGPRSGSGPGPGTDPESDEPLPDILKLKREAKKNRSFAPAYFLALLLLAGLLGYAGYLGFTSFYGQDASAPAPVMGRSMTPAAVTIAPDPVDSFPAGEDPLSAGLPAALEPTSTPGDISPQPLSLDKEGAVEEPAGFPFLVTVRFVEDVWLQVQIDDQPVREGLFRKGTGREWRAHDNLNFFFGNAGGVELTLNGRPLPRLGASGETVRISIPRDLAGAGGLSRDEP
ncbi:MAG: DUF4115 domain-containing protein [Desulfobacterales bacterium]|nr:DUF4115 domain-containing protein [Desulfobacterales bacterium]